MGSHRDTFAGKNVTVMGLGLLGRGLNDVRFLAAQGARLTVTDLKPADELAPSLEALVDFPEIRFVLGEHRFEDFRSADLVLKAAGVPLDSPFVAEARRHGVAVEMDEALFARLSGATIAGVTGTRGKTTTALLLHAMLREAGLNPRLGGNIRGMATLPLLDEVQPGDIVVLELSSWQLQGFGDAEISPHLAVFTNFMPDHLNYYRGDLDRYYADKAQIYRHQLEGDVLITGPEVAALVTRDARRVAPQVARASELPDWRLRLPGAHNRANTALAAAAARALGAADDAIGAAAEAFTGAPERLELVREVGGVSYVDDTTSTIPEATIAAIEAFAGREIVLIAGGVDKGLDYSALAETIASRTKAAVLLEGTATDELLNRLGAGSAHVTTASSMREAFGRARALAAPGDVVLLSPGAASFGLFRNEFDRGEQFVAFVRAV